MKISIIIPVLNQVEFISEAFESFAVQDHPDKELLVIDGGSTDGTIDIINQYNHLISYWESTTDKGQSNAINKGLKLAKGEIVNWLNADDVLLPGALKKINTIFTKNKNIDVLCGKCFRIEGDILAEKQNEMNYSQTILQSSVEKTMVWTSMGQPSQFYRKEIFDRIGLLNETLHYSFDKELWLRYLNHFGQNNIIQSNEFIAVFRLHSSSKTSQHPLCFKQEDDQIIKHIIASHKQSLPISLRKLKGYFYGKKACEYYESYNYSLARSYALKALKTLSFDGKGYVICALKVLLIPEFILKLK